MKRSTELEEITRRWFGACHAGDVDAVLAQWSDGNDILWIGTDPDETWRGPAEIDEVIRKQFDEMGGSFPFKVLTCEAWSEGTVGWSYADMVVEIEPELIPMRHTAVFHREADAWRMVHGLTATPVKNKDTLGELTTSQLRPER